jgi:hypothetical protein
MVFEMVGENTNHKQVIEKNICQWLVLSPATQLNLFFL